MARPLLLGVMLLAAALCTGCGTLFNPYLDATPLNGAAVCPQGGDCTAAGAFKRSQAAVGEVQKNAHEGIKQRALLNTVSSAVAFPLIGILVYKGATNETENGRKSLLKLGLVAAAGYEARNALTAGSPESVYLLSEARLGCVVAESGNYRLDLPTGSAKSTCDTDAQSLRNDILQVGAMTGIDNKYMTPRDELLAKVRNALTQYESAETLITSATAKMQTAARKIVSDTNAQIRTPTVSPATATALLRSDIAQTIPAGQLPPDPKGSAKAANDQTVNIVDQMNQVVVRLNAFTAACVRPQPTSLAPFDACTTYSPAAPPAPTVTTSLGSNPQITLYPGDVSTFIATSAPTGTPWATLPANTSVTPQQVTLGPNQTQISIAYDKSPVAADTQVPVSVTTLGIPGNPVSISLTLKPARTSGGTGSSTPSGGVFDAVRKDADLLKKLGLPATAGDDALRAALETQWRKLCTAAASAKPTDKQLTDPGFFDAVKKDAAANPNQGFCK